MGYYSFYKIFKDIFRTIFGSKTLKFLLIFLLIFCILFLFKNEVFGAYSVVINNNTYILPEVASYPPYYNSASAGQNNVLWVYNFDENNNIHFFSFFSAGEFYVYVAPTNVKYFCSTQTMTYLEYDVNQGAFTRFINVSAGQNGWARVEKYPNIAYCSNTVSDSNGNIYWQPIQYPELTNSIEDLENVTFNTFDVSTRDFYNQDIWMLFYDRSLSNSSTTDGLYPICEKVLAPQSRYFNGTDSVTGNYIYNIPIWSIGFSLNRGSTYEIRFAILKPGTNSGLPPYNYYEYIGDSYTWTISENVSQDTLNNINQQIATSTTDDNFKNLDNSIKEQNENINNINNSINDSTVDNSSIDLPIDNTSDPTQNAVDNIFQNIYNSFTSGTAQDVVFPIPFTNKSITLQANYLYNVLQNSNASWVIMIVQTFWWYLISRFIITDIMKKVRKIKQGNFDNIQNDNIKEDML